MKKTNISKRISTGLLGVVIISAILVGYAEATSLNLPLTPVTMEVSDGIFSYFTTSLSDVPAGYDVHNGTYLGWCIDRETVIPRSPATHEVMLYSSYDPPADLAGYQWDMVNYILNHKQGEMMDIQEAIWYFIDLSGPYTPTTSTAQAIVDDALANGDGFIPGPCEAIAVICYTRETQMTIIELRLCNTKQFTASGAFDGFTAPEIFPDGLGSAVYELHSGPRIWWQVTYHFENSAAFLGDEYDGEGHYFILWDKWGGNLMALDSQPVAFNSDTNIVTLENGEEFDIDPRLGVTEDGYKGYIHPSLDISDLASQGNAYITEHIGDQQQGTNPGRGRGSHPRGGRSYDADIRWEIGWLNPGESAELVIYLAPGKNPGRKLQFSSPGTYCINTGPRVRVYGDSIYEDFRYAVDRTNQLCVLVEEA
jgi:hypothetical protein